jgi:type II secretory pathway pseudopilin PulG
VSDYAEASAEPIRGSRDGMTLVEVVIAVSFITVMCAGLFSVGVKSRSFAEHNRLATEARCLAKERLEEAISMGFENLIKPSCLIFNADTNMSLSSPYYPVRRQPRVAWHKADGTVCASTNAAYAEVHVEVTYDSPLRKCQVTDTYTTLVR